jgi:hypothetical protein
LRVQIRVILVCVAIFGLTGCNGSSGVSTSGPAFEVVNLKEVSCPNSTTASLCEEARIRNVGEAAGEGTCRLRAGETTTDGQDRAVFGDTVAFAEVATGAEVTVDLTWTQPRPTSPFTVECLPGLQS